MYFLTAIVMLIFFPRCQYKTALFRDLVLRLCNWIGPKHEFCSWGCSPLALDCVAHIWARCPPARGGYGIYSSSSSIRLVSSLSRQLAGPASSAMVRRGLGQLSRQNEKFMQVGATTGQLTRRNCRAMHPWPCRYANNRNLGPRSHQSILEQSMISK